MVGAVGVVAALRDGGSSADHEVTRTAGGWEPATLAIARGDTVEFVNASGEDAWPASDVHPTHEVYPGFDAERGVPAGSSWSYTFDRAGSWSFHDHLAPEAKGVVVVR